MKYLAVVLLVSLFSSDGINKIARINQYKKEGNAAYMAEDYKTAAEKYRYLYDTLQVKEDPVMLNLGHSYFHLNDTANAGTFYGLLTESSNNEYRSVAYQQLGVMASTQQNYKLALDRFKNALKADPSNEEARYNYELTKKLLKNQQEQEEQDKNDDKIEPSEFAKRLKEQADALVKNNRFAEAFGLMQQGLERDETVRAYNDFIGKLKDVTEVETSR